MPLIKCAECGREVSSDAAACPHCGKPNAVVAKKKSTSTRDAGCLLMVLAFLGSLVAPGGIQWMLWLLLFVGLVVAVMGMVRK